MHVSFKSLWLWLSIGLGVSQKCLFYSPYKRLLLKTSFSLFMATLTQHTSSSCFFLLVLIIYIFCYFLTDSGTISNRTEHQIAPGPSTVPCISCRHSVNIEWIQFRALGKRVTNLSNNSQRDISLAANPVNFIKVS